MESLTKKTSGIIMPSHIDPATRSSGQVSWPLVSQRLSKARDVIIYPNDATRGKLNFAFNTFCYVYGTPLNDEFSNKLENSLYGEQVVIKGNSFAKMYDAIKRKMTDDINKSNSPRTTFNKFNDYNNFRYSDTTILTEGHINTFNSSKRKRTLVPISPHKLDFRSKKILARGTLNEESGFEQKISNVFYREFHNAVEELESNKLVTDPKTKALSLIQATAAKVLLHRPSSAVLEELRLVAGTLLNFLKVLSNELSTALISKDGVIDKKDTYCAARRVATDSNNTTVTDFCVIFDLLRLIGALLLCTPDIVPPGMILHEDIANQLRECINMFTRGMTPEQVHKNQCLGGSSILGPSKKPKKVGLLEGSRVLGPSNKPTIYNVYIINNDWARIREFDKMNTIDGLHNNGIKDNKIANIPPTNTLPAVTSPLLIMGTSKVERTTEPLVSHISGSPTESLTAWDALMGDHRPYTHCADETQEKVWQKTSYHDNDATSRKKSARLAAITAYNLATGFHSSAEVLESILNYTGQNARFTDSQSKEPPSQKYRMIKGELDAPDNFGEGAATALILELLKHHTN